jgi:uncharacterized protein DUF5985
MAAAVYVLCTLTSALCMVLLFRSYFEKRVRLLLWAGLCFAGLTINNVFLFVDLVLLPNIDLSIPRDLSALAGVSLLLYGLVWDTRE